MSNPEPVRITLLSHAATAAMRAGRFPRPDDPLDDAAHATLRRLSFRPNPLHRCWTSPARRAVETAAALGLEATPEPLLDDADVGRWAGRTVADLEASEPDGLAAWLADPAAVPHGGETLDALRARVTRWLDAQTEGPGVVAVTHAAVIRAAIASALDVPTAAMGRIDVAPLRLSRLSGLSRRWRLVCHGMTLRGAL